MTDHQGLQELAAAYVLGALDTAERTGFEAHLAECPTCRAEVQAFHEVTGVLVHAAPTVTPPPGLRDRILREARQVRPIGARRPPRLPWIAVAASIALALATGYGYWRVRSERDVLRRALAATQDSIAARDSLLATLLSPDAGTAALAATGKPPTARLFWSPSRHRVVMTVFDLPPAPAGRTYQLWAIATGKPPVSLGTFNTAPDGRLTTTMAVPPTLALFQITAVTEEPAGGSPQPTQQPFLIGKLASGD